MVALRDGHQVALFFSGHQHAGENLADVLKHRAKELPPPIQMCDALSRNLPGELQTILANCLAHARRQFVDVYDRFPEQCRYLLETLAVVYRNDAIARQRQLSPEARLQWHQEESQPTMQQLHDWLRRQLDDKLTEPNSALGGAIRYMLRHWEKLTLFLRQAGAPLDNNVCERALKKAILHRKNALFYKTQNGARVGDLFMSLIYTCQLNEANPFDYLTELQRHADQLAASPAALDALELPRRAGLMSDHPTPLGGTCSARFDPLRELFAAKLESGEDLGASLAVNIDGEMVVDLWGGWADEARTVPWTENTITNVFSTTKMHDLARRARAGRPRRTRPRRDRRQVLARVRGPGQGGDQGSPSPVAHLGRLGLGAANHPRGPVRLGQVDRPAGRPGALVGTRDGLGLPHAELRPPDRRSDPAHHRPAPGRVLCRAHCGAAGRRLPHRPAALGVPSRRQRGAAAGRPPTPSDLTQLDPNSVAFKTWTNPTMTAPETSWTEGWRRADIGAANGHGNARSLARLQSAVACGGEVDGVRLLSPQTIDRIFEVQSNGIDLVIGIPIKWGVGYGLCPGRPGVFLGRHGRLVGDYRRGSPHDLRLRDEQDGAGRRDHRSGAGRAGVRHRESLSHSPRIRQRPPSEFPGRHWMDCFLHACRKDTAVDVVSYRRAGWPIGNAFPVGLVEHPQGEARIFRLVLGKVELPRRWICVGREFIQLGEAAEEL